MEQRVDTDFRKSDLFKDHVSDHPVVLIDVGASGGIAERWDDFADHIQVYGFEPDPSECEKINESSGDNIKIFPKALAQGSGRQKFYITKKGTCSSSLKPNADFLKRFYRHDNYEIDRVVEMDCDTLDNIIAENHISDVDFIKLDTQGSELFILQGAESLVEDPGLFGIDIELEFSPLYEDQPLFADVDQFLRRHGFMLFDIEYPVGRKIRKTFGEYVYRKGQALWTHAVYFRDYVSMAREGHLDFMTPAKSLKTIAISEVYRFTDYALELLDLYKDRGVIEADLYTQVKNVLSKPKKRGYERELWQHIKSDIRWYLSKRFPFFRDY